MIRRKLSLNSLRLLEAHRLPIFPLLAARRSFSTSAMGNDERYQPSVAPCKRPSRSPDDAELKKHHVSEGKRRFKNPWPSFHELQVLPTLSARIQSRLQHGLGGPARNPPFIPVAKPQFPSEHSPSESRFRATWMGHASYYIEFPGGLRVLTDPIFSERSSPVSWFGPKRFTEAPCKITDIPAIDVVVISHNHYDHCDEPTLREIKETHPNAWYFVPLGNQQRFNELGIEKLTELDWWEEQDFKLTPEVSENHGHKQDITATFGCLPCQHMSGRMGTIDNGYTLWSSWSIESGGKKLYFAGDTGYRAVPRVPAGVDDYGPEYADLPTCPAFREIGEYRGPFDLGLIPIGAYSPRSSMSPMHANPYDSVNIFVETKCKRALGIHWGTFALTEEPIEEPPSMLRDALEKRGLPPEGLFDVQEIGGSTIVTD